MTKDRIVKRGAVAADVPQLPVAPFAELMGDVVLGATIDESVAAVAPVADVIVEAPKAKRAKKDDEPVAEPRQATVAEMMAQSLRNHQEHTDRANAIAELQKQLKNL